MMTCKPGSRGIESICGCCRRLSIVRRPRHGLYVDGLRYNICTGCRGHIMLIVVLGSCGTSYTYLSLKTPHSQCFQPPVDLQPTFE
ncbi:hypothetical protein BDV09DRAFT_174893 [Aspergillus tetrazonus]